MPLAAKEEMFSTCSDPCVLFPLAADPAELETRFGTTPQLSENSRQGFARRKTARRRGHAWSNSARALGIEEVLLESRVGCRSSGNTSGGGGSTLDDRANALANAINKTGVQSLGNPCTVAAFYGASALGGAATSGEVYAQGAEAAITYWPQALSQVSNWLYRQSLRGGPVANFILNIPKNYNKAKAAVLGGCNAMQ